MRFYIFKYTYNGGDGKIYTSGVDAQSIMFVAGYLAQFEKHRGVTILHLYNGDCVIL